MGEGLDGRSQRRLRTEDAVVGAILDLLGVGVAQPTAQEVSDRSGVSLRSIFRLFQDMEALNARAIAHQQARIEPLLVVLPAEGRLADRIRALVENRAVVFDTIAPVRRLGIRLAPTSPTIAAELARFGRFFRRQIATVFAAELATDETGDLLDALDAAASWETWERLRRGQDLATGRAHRVVTRILTGLLA